MSGSTATRLFREARDVLLRHRTDPDAARAEFAVPRPAEFNWALDWFDIVASTEPTRSRIALRIVGGGMDEAVTFGALSARSTRLAAWFADAGLARGDRVLVLLDNRVELWETMLACWKLGVTVVPAATMLSPAEVADRIGRAGIRHLVTDAQYADALTAAAEGCTRLVVGGGALGWTELPAPDESPASLPPGVTRASDPLLLYFTSGTTAAPKLVEHTHATYPIGHLSTMYWIGLQPGDVHVSVASPGWAKHAWSNVFAPWNAEATIVAFAGRFEPEVLLRDLARLGVTTFCAPPTAWRMLVQEDLGAVREDLSLRELVAAGEPLNPEVIETVEKAWGLTIRDGYGQTETTAQIANPPGRPIVAGAMGRPLPGYEVVLRVPGETIEAGVGEDGEVCLVLDAGPIGLMTGYRDDPARTAEVLRDGVYHTGDLARRDADGSITFVGRTDDVFKASGYRISPFEIESVLLEHEAVAEAAVVPAHDELRGAVPKAYIAVAPGHEPSAETAAAVFRHARRRLAPYKRIRRLEFAELPKTISGKIRRAELRAAELEGGDSPRAAEHRDEHGAGG